MDHKLRPLEPLDQQFCIISSFLSYCNLGKCDQNYERILYSGLKHSVYVIIKILKFCTGSSAKTRVTVLFKTSTYQLYTLYKNFIKNRLDDSREGLDLLVCCEDEEEEEEELLKQAIALSLEGAEKNDSEDEDKIEEDAQQEARYMQHMADTSWSGLPF